MKHLRLLLALCLALCLACPAALADAVTFEGTVVSGESVSVTAPFGGTIASFGLRQGGRIKMGDEIAEIETTKVYAPESGVISG
ncbi:MAG: hypothetical protein IJ461_00315, partial [Clostridia bacterium]|nr:hypothetical protein [Clostridia bacterium]